MAALYVLCGRLGRFAALPPGHITPIWPASGVALAALLLRGRGVWPGVWLGSFAVNLWIGMESEPRSLGEILGASATIGTGAALQAYAGVLLLRGIAPLRSARGLVSFVGAALLSCVVNATVGTTVLWLALLDTTVDYQRDWLTWWLGDSAGVLLVTPLLLSLTDSWSVPAPRRRSIEAGALAAAVVVAGLVGFWGQYPLGYLAMPALVWAGMRFGVRGSAAAILGLATIALAGAANGVGPFVGSHLSLNESLLLLQGFMAVAVLTTLSLATVVGESQQAEAEVARARDTLEQQVGERTRLLDESNRSLRDLSELDGLTGIANRRRFDAELGAAGANGTTRAVVLFDIDAFKPYNDNNGHQAGDDCLRRVAARIRDEAGGAHLVARYGGDEFVVLLTDAPGTLAEDVAERMRAAVEALAIPHVTAPLGVVTVSAGVATGSGATAAGLISRADAALYAAKNAGRNLVVLGA